MLSGILIAFCYYSNSAIALLGKEVLKPGFFSPQVRHPVDGRKYFSRFTALCCPKKAKQNFLYLQLVLFSLWKEN